MYKILGIFLSSCLFISAAHADEAIDITPKEEVWISEPITQKEYLPKKLEIVTSDVEFEEPAPYLGLGFTDKNNENEKWEFKVNIGVKYNGDADIDANGETSYQTELLRKSWELQNNSDELEFNPVVMMGFQYHF